jgi:hypothetical protein
MDYDLINLVKCASKYPNFEKRILRAVAKYKLDPEAKKMATENLKEYIALDKATLESLVNPEDFNYQEPDLGKIEVENVE